MKEDDRGSGVTRPEPPHAGLHSTAKRCCPDEHGKEWFLCGAFTLPCAADNAKGSIINTQLLLKQKSVIPIRFLTQQLCIGIFFSPCETHLTNSRGPYSKGIFHCLSVLIICIHHVCIFHGNHLQARPRFVIQMSSCPEPFHWKG